MSDDISLIKRYVNKNTLVILDLDDTLIRSKTTLGSPACFYRLRDKYIEKSDQLREEVTEAFCLFDKALQKHVEYTHVDPQARELIDQLQSQGISVIGLTNRPAQLVEATGSILQKIGLQLGKSLPFSSKIIEGERKSFFKYGVIFAGDGAKSVVLHRFIEDHLPNKEKYVNIVFVDDKELHVRDIGEYAVSNGYDFFGLYYIKEKEKQRKVNLSIAEEQMKHLICFSTKTLEMEHSTQLDPKAANLFFVKGYQEGVFFLIGNILPDEFIKNSIWEKK